uniref:Proline-rich transmembrane protein 3/4 domain-containing protein n=1 Tax=Strigamia maritima TaxID=126957 RepID=T1IHH6_STRMM
MTTEVDPAGNGIIAANNATTPVMTSTVAPTSVWWRGEVFVVPKWTLVDNKLTWVWLVHVYGAACLFFLLASYTFFTILYLRAQLSSRPFMTTINTFVCVLGSTRAAFFLIDPYNSKKIIPEAFCAILWELAFPCLVSAFSLVQLAFLHLTQLQFGPGFLRSKSWISFIVSIHFCIVIATNIMWTFRDDLKLLNLGINAGFCIWAAFLCLSFLLWGFRTMMLLKLLPPILFPGSETKATTKSLLQLGLLTKCNNLASVAATVAAPTLVLPPKIHITDENDYSYSQIENSSNVEVSTCETTESSSRLDDTRINCELTPRRQKELHVRICPVSHILQNGSVTKGVVNDIQIADEDHAQSSLLSDSKTKKDDFQFTLSSVLNHLAYMDHAMEDFKPDNHNHRVKTNRCSQIQKVLQATCLAAFLGVVVTICQLFNIFGPYGLCWSGKPPSHWPWLIFHTIFRLAEFMMGCVMANITKQPVNRHNFPYLSQCEDDNLY